MKIWVVSMECSGIVEAGGVKNVTFSLCKEFQKLGNEVTLFIPAFKTTDYKSIIFDKDSFAAKTEIFHCGKNETVSYKKGKCINGDFQVIFMEHPSFLEKEGVYTYTANENRQNPEFVKGHGHKDMLFMDSLFAKSVIHFSNFIETKDIPDFIHCQDASTALIPGFGAENQTFDSTKFIVTIHNAGPAYHHNFSSIGEASWYTGFNQDLLYKSLNNDKVEPFLIAANVNASLSTVSEEYAKELCNPIYASETEGLSQCFNNKNIQIMGITNGIDYEGYDPTDINNSKLPYAFNPGTKDLQGKADCRSYFVKKVLKNRQKYSDVSIYGELENANNCNKEIYIVYHGRVTWQKGLPVLMEAIPAILNNFSNVRFLITGQGEVALENSIKEITEKYKGSVVFINGYNKELARLTNAIGDFIVLPSHFEPCGLEDFISQIFGTLPVAHKTGGLNKIVNGKTGFLYSQNTKEALIAKLSEVITIKIYKPEVIEDMIQYTDQYIKNNYLWPIVIKTKYMPYFKKNMKNI